jgi:hypothetical protein
MKAVVCVATPLAALVTFQSPVEALLKDRHQNLCPN